MKQRISLLIASLLFIVAGMQTAQAQKMVVRTADGKVVKYNVTKVTEVTFEEAEPVEWIDLGLPSGTLWASCNIGANNPEDYGYYFAWGETEQKSDYTWSTYFDYDADDSSNRHKKYNKDSGLTELLPEDDAASTIWDVSCKMPSKAQFEELLNSNYTTQEWTQLDGVNGTRITSIKNGNSIFLPAAGFRNGTSILSQGRDSYYWSRTLSEASSSSAECIYSFNAGSLSTIYSTRSLGFSVRPVRMKELYVDLGLPSGTLWAMMNLGADAPEEYGDYFAWGETEPKEDYDWDTYKWCKGSWDNLTKYCYDSSCGNNGFTDGLTELKPNDDAATVNRGSEWQMPNNAQWQELVDNCTWTWTTQNNVNGCLVTGTNGKSIFLPAAGFIIGTESRFSGECGYYWSSSLNSEYTYQANYLSFDSDRHNSSFGNRDHGRLVRPVVCVDPPVLVEQIVLSPASLNLYPGDTQTLSATVLPGNADNKIVTWESSSTSVATVSNEGLVTAVAPGTCTIICRATDDSDVYAECQVTVSFVDNSGIINGRAFVDLALPSGTLWATMNVGADAPEEYGNFFAWGETESKSVYNWDTYKYCKGTSKTLTKYCTSSTYGYNGFADGLTKLKPEDDAATVNWGSEWQMPSGAQWKELLDNCTWTWTKQNYVNGCLVTGINGKSIFLPAAGDFFDDTRRYAGENGYYWSSTLSDYSNQSRDFFFNKDEKYNSTNLRYNGQSVRPVRKQ